MARFFVGQRVRIVKSVKPFMVGKEAKIWMARHHPHHVDFGDGFYFYLDVVGMGKRNAQGNPIAYMEEQLEPILPQHQPCESDFKETLDRLVEELEAVQ